MNRISPTVSHGRPLGATVGFCLPDTTTTNNRKQINDKRQLFFMTVKVRLVDLCQNTRRQIYRPTTIGVNAYNDFGLTW